MRLLKKYQELVLLLAVAVLIPFIFIFIHPKPVAALFAGTLFNALAIALLAMTWKLKGLIPLAFKLSVGIFLLVFSIPIMGARILNWGVDFNTLSWWGFSADQWHRNSTYVYWVLVVEAIALDYKK